MPLLPVVLVPLVPFPLIGASDGAGVPLAGTRYGCIIGAVIPVPPGGVGAAEAAEPAPLAAGVRCSSGIGFSDGVGASIGGAVG